MAMVGYDMSILGPLLSLPMFAEKYQGNPGPLTVSRYYCILKFQILTTKPTC